MSYSTVIPGLPGGPLTTSFPINVNLIDSWRTNNRPGIKLRGGFSTTQHMTANWNTLAPAEAAYLRNGAGGRQASWHATGDDRIVEVTLPVDEVGWHASDGAGPGNMSTVAYELTQQRAMVNNPVRWRRARSNAAEFMGKIAARKAGDNRGEFHHNRAPDKKWCPKVLLDAPAWVAEYHEDYAHFYAMEREAMTGKASLPEDAVINIGDTIRTLVSLNVRQDARVSAPIVATLPIGTDIVVNGRWESADGYGWLPVSTPSGNGAVAMGDASGPFIEKVRSASKPESQSTYVKAVPIPALLDTDMAKHDTAEGITTDDTGNEFIFVADVIEFTKPTVAGEFAVDNPRPVKEIYQPQDRAIAAWLVKAKHGEFFYVLTGPGDEWIRVPYANTRRVSDAPLLKDEWGDEDADVSEVVNALSNALS